MNETLRKLLSAYLDQQLLPDERRNVEARLAQDPEARAELEQMRQLAGMIELTVPPALSAPKDLRARIMDRVRLEGSGPGQGGPRHGGTKLPPYWIAGTVLVGLVGGMLYVDLHKSRTPKPTTLGRIEFLPAEKNPPTVAPALKSGVAPEDIQGSNQKQGTAPTPAGPVQGEVYTLGQGGATKAGGLASPAGLGQAAALTDLASAPARAGKGQALNLESASGWTADSVRRALPLARAGQTVQALNLARSHNLNPGLLAAAAQDFPESSLFELAGKLRSALQATRGQPEKERLPAILTSLGGDPARTAAWEKKLRP